MTRKKEKLTDPPRFEVKKRTTKEKPDYFQNIPSFAHPLAEIFKNTPEQRLETQPEKLEESEPLDLETQNDIFGNPKQKSLDANQPKKQIWKPKKFDDLDTIQPKNLNLETQKNEKTSNSGYLKKYEKARSTEPIHARVEKAVAQRIRHFLVDSKFTLKEFVELSATKFIDEFGNPNKKSLDANQPYDDRRMMITWKSRHFIINLYLQMNLIFNKKTKWTVRDDEAASKFNDVDFRLIELGMIQTQANKNYAGKINSFSYYANEIQNFVDLNLPSESIEIMLEINRRRWSQATGKTIKTENIDDQPK